VTDFGLAKADDQQNLTHTGDILGTLRYMPPEAFDGKSDARGDVYSLGVTLYELLAFRPAFEERERNRLIKQVTHHEPVRLGRLNRQVPRDLETIVHKAIDKDPKQRYASARALAEDLQRFLEDEPIQARRVSQPERLRRWCRRNPVVASLTAALVLAFLAGFAGVAWKWQDAERQKDLAQVAEQKEAAQRAVAEEQAERATREAKRGRRLLYAADMNQAQQAWEVGETGRALDLLERQRPQGGQEDLRGFEWRCLRQLCQDRSRQTLHGHTGEVQAAVFSQDGRTLVTSSEDHSVRIWDLASGRHIKLQGFRQVRGVALAPDGKTLAIVESAGRTVHLWDVDTRCEQAALQHPGQVFDVAFSQDGQVLSSGCDNGVVRLWNVATRRQTGALSSPPFPVFRVAFSPDGRTLAAGSADSTVRLWDVAARRVVATLRGHTAGVCCLSFSPDGKTLASSSHDTTVRLWDTTSGQAVTTLRGERMALSTVAFNPDGKALATGGPDGTVRVWDAATKEMTAMFRGHRAAITTVGFALDGRSLVSGSADGTVKLWDAAVGTDPNLLTGFTGSAGAVAISPDSKTLAVADTYAKTVKLWDLAARHGDDISTNQDLPVWGVTFAPGGQTLACPILNGTVQLRDVATKELVAAFQHGKLFPTAVFSPDGKLLATGDWMAEKVWVWDISSKRQLTELQPGGRPCFSHDGRMLAASSGNTVRLWDVATWQITAALPGPTAGVSCLAFAPDSRTLAAGLDDGTLRLWDVVGQRQLASRMGHAWTIESLAFSPDGRRLATGGRDRTVKLWDVPSLQEMTTLTGHYGPVTSVAFSRDGNLLASAGADATVRLWQAPPLTSEPPEPADVAALPPVETIHIFTLELLGAAEAKLTSEGNTHRVDVTAVDDTHWHAKLVRVFDDLQEGVTYTIRFRAKADAPRSIALYGLIAQPDWHGIGLQKDFSLTEDWQDYECQFRAKDLAALNRIEFQVGQRTGTVWIADFTIVKNAM
jgi:WD40 repeat protein